MSSDRGSTWNAINSGLINRHINVLAIDPQTPTTLWAATNNGVFTSTDSGVSWSARGLTRVVEALVIDPVTPTTLYAGVSRGGVFKSTDGGDSWTAINDGLTNLRVNALAIDPLTPTIVYAATEGGGVFVLQVQGSGTKRHPDLGPNL